MTTLTQFIPHYKRDGNIVIKKTQEQFSDRNGNKAVLTKVFYQTKKGSILEDVIQVKWC